MAKKAIKTYNDISPVFQSIQKVKEKFPNEIKVVKNWANISEHDEDIKISIRKDIVVSKDFFEIIDKMTSFYSYIEEYATNKYLDNIFERPLGKNEAKPTDKNFSF